MVRVTKISAMAASVAALAAARPSSLSTATTEDIYEEVNKVVDDTTKELVNDLKTNKISSEQVPEIKHYKDDAEGLKQRLHDAARKAKTEIESEESTELHKRHSGRAHRTSHTTVTHSGTGQNRTAARVSHTGTSGSRHHANATTTEQVEEIEYTVTDAKKAPNGRRPTTHVTETHYETTRVDAAPTATKTHHVSHTVVRPPPQHHTVIVDDQQDDFYPSEFPGLVYRNLAPQNYYQVAPPTAPMRELAPVNSGVPALVSHPGFGGGFAEYRRPITAAEYERLRQVQRCEQAPERAVAYGSKHYKVREEAKPEVIEAIYVEEEHAAHERKHQKHHRPAHAAHPSEATHAETTLVVEDGEVVAAAAERESRESARHEKAKIAEIVAYLQKAMRKDREGTINAILEAASPEVREGLREIVHVRSGSANGSNETVFRSETNLREGRVVQPAPPLN